MISTSSSSTVVFLMFFFSFLSLRLIAIGLFYVMSSLVPCLFVCRFQQFFSNIKMVSGCDRELNVHFYSAVLPH